MPTVVVSGRVDEDVKVRADAVIRAAGSSVARVINDVWRSIADSGELPSAPELSSKQSKKRAAFESFMEWFDGLPPQNETVARMTDDEILAGRLDDYA
ncbi:MAG: type II toxin-antitoxin system RelB/DinJ family antitoxin [Atopobiaceae bacterium]|nr:type II toxin-antitoxin system RelB/DinJ family antitoxin [Atopobiaceae bacterium]